MISIDEKEIDDIEIIRKIIEGEDASFALLVKKYLNSVFWFILKMVFDRSMAEDLSQETFIKAWKNLKRFDQKKSFKTWIFTIAKNTAIDYLKKKKETPFSFFEDDEGKSFIDEIKDEENLPDEIIFQKNDFKILENGLLQISPSQRLILELYYKEDLPLSEISEILEEPYNSTKSRHLRALKSLKKAMENNQAIL